MATIKVLRDLIREKVDNVWVPEHDVYGHHYRKTGSQIIEDSVTTRNIMDKPGLIPWAVRLGIEWMEEDKRFERLSTPDRKDTITAATLQYQDVRDSAGDVGTQAHNAVEAFINKWIDDDEKPRDIRQFMKKDDDYKAVSAARAAEQVFVKHDKVVPLVAEITVGMEGLGAGTLDLVVQNEKGQIEIWDWKTSNSVNDFYACQIAAYARMFEVMTGLKVSACRIFKLDKKTARATGYSVPDIQKAFDAYISNSKIYDWINNGKPKLEVDKKRLKI